MSSAVEQFILQKAARPLGTTLDITARDWARRHGWDDPCGGRDTIIGPDGAITVVPCHCPMPRASYESVCRAVAALANEGVLILQDGTDDRGYRVTHLAIPGSLMDNTHRDPEDGE